MSSGMTRREFLRQSAILSGAAMLAPSMLWSAESGGARPNVVFILTDDQFRENFGCYGSSEGLTPNVDKLAAGGVKFTHACVTSSMCAPSRVSCLSGRYAGRHMPYVLNTGARLPVTQPTVASLLKAAGYRTCFIGKAHFHVHGLKGVPAKQVQERMKKLGFDSVPDAHYARFKKGDHLKYQEKDFELARTFYQRAGELGIDGALINYALGVNAFAEGRYGIAEEHLVQARELDPESYREKSESLLQRIKVMR